MKSYQTFAAGQVMTLAECLVVIDAAKNGLPGYREVFQGFNNSAEFTLRSNWQSLLNISGVEFAGRLICFAKMPKKADLCAEFQKMLSLIQNAFPEKYFLVDEEFRLKSSKHGQRNETIEVKYDSGKTIFTYATCADGVNEIEQIFNAVIAIAEVPIRFERRGEDYYLIPLRSDLAFRTYYATTMDGANARKFVCEMPSVKFEALLFKVESIVKMLGDSSPVKGSWFYSPRGNPEDRAPWRKELEFFAANDFPFSEVDIDTRYSLNDLKVLGSLKELGVKKSWFKTSVAGFEFPGSDISELFVNTTPKGHQLFVMLPDKKLIGKIQDVLNTEFRPNKMWD